MKILIQWNWFVFIFRFPFIIRSVQGFFQIFRIRFHHFRLKNWSYLYFTCIVFIQIGNIKNHQKQSHFWKLLHFLLVLLCFFRKKNKSIFSQYTHFISLIRFRDLIYGFLKTLFNQFCWHILIFMFSYQTQKNIPKFLGFSTSFISKPRVSSSNSTYGIWNFSSCGSNVL